MSNFSRVPFLQIRSPSRNVDDRVKFQVSNIEWTVLRDWIIFSSKAFPSTIQYFLAVKKHQRNFPMIKLVDASNALTHRITNLEPWLISCLRIDTDRELEFLFGRRLPNFSWIWVNIMYSTNFCWRSLLTHRDSVVAQAVGGWFRACSQTCSGCGQHYWWSRRDDGMIYRHWKRRSQVPRIPFSNRTKKETRSSEWWSLGGHMYVNTRQEALPHSFEDNFVSWP